MDSGNDKNRPRIQACGAQAQALYRETKSPETRHVHVQEDPRHAFCAPRRCRPCQPIPTAREHFIFHRPLKGPYPPGWSKRDVRHGMLLGRRDANSGSAERHHITAVGYAGGLTPTRPTRRSARGRTGHNEVVLVVFDPGRCPTTAAQDLLGKPRPDPGHAPGQRHRHAISLRHLCLHAGAAQSGGASRRCIQKELKRGGFDAITTEILDAPAFYFAEDYHQQYLAKNPAATAGWAAPA